jgi:REP element-mobilizing transposase RayT
VRAKRKQIQLPETRLRFARTFIMVVAHHLIWTAYGWWLPNDPRGSSSHEIRVERIAELGELHRGRKTVQPYPEEIRRFYEQASNTLKHELLTFDAEDTAVLASSFEDVIRECGYTCYSCAMMPDHVHLLIRKHRDPAETMIANLQGRSRSKILEANHRASNHPVWGGPGWKVFLNSRADIERVDHYIRMNPIKAGMPAQEWAFVKRYDGWMPRAWWIKT